MEPVEAIAVRGDCGGVRMVTVPVSISSGKSLRILRAGVCGTDLQIASRVRRDRAKILGHEALAITDERQRRTIAYGSVDVSHSPTTYRRIELIRPGCPALITARVQGRRPGKEWALIAPREIGICRSDLKELLGVRQARRDFGHEVVADVVDCAGAGSLKPGDTVILNPHITVTRTSGFGKLIELQGRPGSLDRALLRLTAPLASHRGIFVEPLACAARCVRRVQEALATLGKRRSAVAIVGAGTFGVLIASLMRAAGENVHLLNRSRGRLDFLEQRGIFAASKLMTLGHAEQRRFTSIVLATTFAEPRLVSWCAEHADDAALITIFGGTNSNMKIGEDGIDLDILRRKEELREVHIGGRSLWLAGCHGAEHQDFTRAMTVLAQDAEVMRTVIRFRGPELSLREAVDALPLYARSQIYGKPVVRLQYTNHATV
jgi:threonine dehydrogenase-like Zn-dependent dehydrogenase